MEKLRRREREGPSFADAREAHIERRLLRLCLFHMTQQPRSHSARPRANFRVRVRSGGFTPQRRIMGLWFNLARPQPTNAAAEKIIQRKLNRDARRPELAHP